MFQAAERLFSLAFYPRVRKFAKIPGPEPKFPVGNALDFFDRDRQPWEVCADYARKYGGITLIWIGPRPVIVLNDARLIRDVLDGNWRSYYKGDPVKALLPVVGRNNVFVANEPQWSGLRAGDPMGWEGFDDWVRTQALPMQQVVRRHLRRLWEAPAAADASETVLRISFDALNEAVCGVEVGEDAYRDFIKTAEVGNRRMMSKLPIPEKPIDPEFLVARQRWFTRFEALVEETTQHDNPERTDLLSELIRRGTQIPKQVLRDAAATTAHGGAFSVASAVVSALFLLWRMPQVAARLRGELAAAGGSFDAETLDRCPYLDAVLRETLRYYTPVPLFFRNVNKSNSVSLGRHRLPPDTQIYITNWHLHRCPEHWADADDFLPERWLDGGVEANPIGSDYFFPFGRGPRMCIGAPLAMMYMKVALATIVSETEVEFGSEAVYQQGFFFGVMTPQGLDALFRPIRPTNGQGA